MRPYYQMDDKIEVQGDKKTVVCECGESVTVKWRYATFGCPSCDAILADGRHKDRRPLEQTDGQSSLGQFL